MKQIGQTVKQKIEHVWNHVNKDYLPFVLVMILALAIMTFGYLYFTFTPHLVLNEDGYAVSDKKMTTNLVNGITKSSKEVTTRALSLKASDTLYQNQQTLYLGESHKKGLAKDYPLFLNQGLAILNVSSKNDLIDASFNRYAGYENFIISDGSIYHYLEKEKVDQRTYYFLKMPNQLYINLRPMKITTSLHTYEIKMNSIVYVSESEIRYYTLEQGVFHYHEILDCDFDTTVMIADTKYDYGTVLEKLELQDPIKEEQPAEVTPTDPSKPTVGPVTSPKPTPEVSYEKPTVRISEVKAGIYSVRFAIEIHDPSGVITSYPSIEVRTKEKLHLRRMIQNSGTSELVGLLPDTAFQLQGSFTYVNQEGTLVKETIPPISFHTKKISDLKPIKMQLKNGAIYSKKIELSSVAILSDLQDEAVKGIVKGEITIDGEAYTLPKKQLVALLNGEHITYQSPERIASNKTIAYAFHFYDSTGNALQVASGTGTTRTAKASPKVDIINQKTDISKVTLKLREQNPDQVLIQRYHYVVRTRAGVELSRGNITGTTLEIKNLNSENLYVIEVIGTYDVEDGRGIQKDQVLGSLEFISKPLGSLGYLQLTTKVDQVTDQSAKLHMAINDKKSDNRYLELLGAIQVNIVRSDNGEVVYQKRLQGSLIDQLTRLDQVDLDLSHLNPYTTYDIVMEAIIYQGEKEYHNQTTLSQKQFMTKKREASVLVKNLFVTGNMYDYDVKIADPDGAILKGSVTVEIRNHQGILIETTKMEPNHDYERINKDKLVANQTYTITYIASSYNSGVDNSTYQKNYVLYEQKIRTEPTIQGDIALNYVREISTSKNVLNGLEQTYSGHDDTLSCDRKISSISCERVTATSGTTLIYLARDVKLKPNTKYVLSFYYKASEQVPETVQKVWFYNNMGGGLSQNPTIVTGTKKRLYYTFQTTADTSEGYYIYLNTPNMKPGDQVMYEDIMLEEGTKPSKFEPYKMDQDAYDASFTYQITNALDTLPTEDYYVRMYEGDQLLEEYQYDITDTSGVLEQKYYQLKRNQNYTFELLLKIRDRYYTFGSYTFDTKETLTAIHNERQFTHIMPYRKYVVVADLDLTNINHPYMANEIDFLGHTIFRRYSGGGRIWSKITEDGVVKNLNLEIAYANQVITSSQGIALDNYGQLENIIVSLVESYPTRNRNNYLLCQNNYGTIDRFVIQLKSPFYGIELISPGIGTNHGVVKNGYITGDIYSLSAEDDTFVDVVGGIAMQVYQTGTVEHVYSMANIKTTRDQASDNLGLVLGNTKTSNVRNIYSTGTIDHETPAVKGPAIAFAGQRLKYSYYVADQIYDNNYNTKISYLSLKDKTFQNKVLNGDDAFEVDHLIDSGYYPHVKMSDVMPDQELLPLPKVADEDLVDIISNEVVSQNKDTAVIKIKVNNPSHEKINKLAVQYLTTKIVNQEDLEGKSTLTVELSNPTKYRSSYSVLSVTSVGPYGIAYTRDYQEKERLLNVDIYKPIYTIADWKEINNDVEGNYQLQNDLDFKNAIGYVIRGKFSGILDGKGHTIKNIDLGTSASYIHMFDEVTGTIQNLTVDRLIAVSENGTYTAAAFIGILNSYSVIDHVHIKNSSLKGGVVGGLVRNATGATIRNSSVSNLKLEVESKRTISNGYAGGFVATASSVSIENCFASNVKIDATKAKIPYGFGAMVGYSEAWTTLTNVYATGEIKANSPYVGGIIGKGTSYISITNGYSMVTITGSQGYTGGIAGDARGMTLKNIISLGDIYSTNPTVSLKRVVGYQAASTIQNNIYGYTGQLLNGYTSDEADMETLLSREQIMDGITLKDQVKLGRAFAYGELDKGYLPKLYDTSGQILENQPDLTLKEEELTIEQVEIDKKTDQATIYLLIDNPGNYPIEQVSFDYLTIKKINKNHTSNGKTIMELSVVPDRAYDSYQLTGLTYRDGDATKRVVKQARMDIQFYKDIENYSDWQAIPKDTAENYRLVTDLDFKDRVNVNTNVSLGRLESVNGKHKIKNFTSKDKPNEYLIESISLSLKNIIFEDIEISNSNSNILAGAMIQTFSGEMEEVVFQNININVPNATYTGSIGYVIDGIKMDHITLRDITVSGGTYTGGLFAYGTASLSDLDAQKIHVIGNGANSNPSSNAIVGGVIGQLHDKGGAHSNIQLREINVYDRTEKEGKSGGFIGFYSNQHQNTTYENVGLMDTRVESALKNNSYNGGFFGYSGISSGTTFRITDLEVLDVSLLNGKQIGGVSGYGLNFIMDDSEIQNVKIDSQNQSSIAGGVFGMYGEINRSTVRDIDLVSLGSSTGIVFGQYGAFNDSLVTDSRVQGINNVGGIHGWRCNSLNSAVKHNTIIGQDNVGAFCGSADVVGVTTSFSDQNQIYGRNNVGNVAGQLLGGSGSIAIVRTYHRNQLVASGVSVGGFIGEVDGTKYNGPPRIIDSNMIIDSDLTGQDYIGGLIGNNVDDTVTVTFKNTVVLADITKQLSGGSHVSMGMGSTPFQNTTLEKFLVYEGNTINGKQVAADQDYLTSQNMVSAPQLHEAATYENLNFRTSQWIHEPLKTGHHLQLYKKQEGLLQSVRDQELIPLPTASNVQRRAFSARSSFLYHELPTVDLYASDVDKVNLEFSKVDLYTTYRYEVDGKLSEAYPITERTVTFQYDFHTKVKIIVSDGLNTKTYTIDPDLVSRKLYVDGTNYYYLQNGQVFSNEKGLNHKAIHIMKGKSITSDGTIYDLNGQRLTKVTEPIKVLVGKTPLYTAMYQDHKIETYLRYTMIDEQEKEGQFYVKGQMLSMIDASLENDKRAVLIDQYNGAEYETILGNDGKLYHLKASIAVSKNFNNKQIVEISDTVTSDTPLLLVRYRDGSVLGFNYQTGEELVLDMVKKKVSLFDYAQSFLKGHVDATIPSMSRAYEQAEKLEKQLLDQPLTEPGQEPNKLKTNPYMKVYQPLTKQFSIYHTNTILEKEETKSETDKIQAAYDLAVLYQTDGRNQRWRLPINGVAIFFFVIISVFGVLGYYYIHEVKKTKIDV